MKQSLIYLTAALMVLPLRADFENWTNAEGKVAQLDLIEVKGEGDDKEGVFKMRNGRQVTIKKKDLSEADATRLDEWKAPEPEQVAAATPSVFDEVLDGNLEILDGKRLKKHELSAKPKKYYVFYYTASWCPPCQAFTPELVRFYNKNKNDNFELVLITSDRDEDAMEEYASDKKMPWPQLKLSKAPAFKGKFKHGVTGIPSVITCDLEGNIVSKTENLKELEKLVK